MARLRAIRGTRDLCPGQIERWHYLEAKVRSIMGRFGYEEIRTPIFEATELFSRSIGADTDIVQKEMYTFCDRKGRSLTLRPEGTAPVARAFLESNMARGKAVAKLYYMGPMFRYERPQKGRSRQFHQFGTEAVGSPDPRYDAETIGILHEVLCHVGLSPLTVKLGSVGDEECRPAYVRALSRHLESHREELCDDCKGRLGRNPLRVLDCKNARCVELRAGAPSLLDRLCEPCEEHLRQVESALESARIPFEREGGLVRGLDYYTRTVFEIHHDELGAQSALGGGGRYDRLIADLGGPLTPGVGFSAGMERIIMVAESLQIRWIESVGLLLLVGPIVAEAEEKVFPLLHKLRRRWNAEGSYEARSLKTILRHASRASADIVLLLGEEELENQSVTVKRMDSGEQSTVPLERVLQAIEPLAAEIEGRRTRQEEPD